jgi:CubicO group peptidase (beta-lactamase class C family)
VARESDNISAGRWQLTVSDTQTGQGERLRERLDAFLDREIEIGSFPGAVYAIGTPQSIVAENALGYSVVLPAKMKTSVETIYDVASVSKPVITATLALIAAQEKVIDLSQPVSKLVPELGEDKRELTFVDLLTHRAGFQAWYPVYTQGVGEQSYLDALVRRPLRYRAGTREIYSCLGYLLLYLALQRGFGEPLAEVSRKRIFEPLGLKHSMFNPAPDMKYVIAATEWGNANERQMVAERNIPFRDFRNYMIWGEVNDGNAFYMGGFGGNAGLFATARDVYRISASYLEGGGELLSKETLEIALRNYTLGLEENRAIGWQLQAQRTSHPSAPLSETSFGHTGFTGTSVWLDPERGLVIVLLTNRLHPSLKPLNMQNVRRRFHQIVVEEWDR